MKALVTALVLAVPPLAAASLHMAVVRLGLLPRLKRPIHARALGPNKTWRGLVVMPLAALLGVHLGRLLEPAAGDLLLVSLQARPAVVLGIALGLAYALFELPNSYVKRRLGIPPGKLPARHGWLFGLVDQTDSVVGCALVYALLLRPPLAALALCLLVGPVIHLIANVTLYVAGLRREPV